MYQINSILLLLLIFTNQYLSQNLINKTINEINKIDDFDIGHNDNHNEISISLLELFENFNVKYHDDNFEMISFDGWYHDLHQPDLGSIGSSLKRFFSSSSSFKVDKQIDSNRSINHNDNVFRISESLFKTNRIHYYSMNGRNLLSIYFGMFVLNDMLDTMKDKCPMNYRKISLPKTFIDQSGNEISYNSSIYDDNVHDYIYVNDFENCKLSSSINDRKSRINFRSIWIDGEIIYGNSKFCSDYVRTFERGKLIDFTSGINDKYRSELFGRECFNYYGNNPINENPFMITIHFIWINLHNLIAEIINKQNTGLTDQFIYDQSRKYTIAILQNIVFNEWLPSLIGEQLPRYHGYDSMIDPRITDLFDLLSNTYLYTMLTSFVFRLNPMECKKKQFNYSILRLCNTYYEPLNYFKQNNFQNLLFGLLLQSSKRNDHYLINDILLFAKNDLYNHNYNYNRKNLFALLLQHSRDYRLDDYLTIRRKIGMDIDYNYNNQTFEDLLNNQWSFAKSLDEKLEFKLRNLYNNNVDQIDLLVGGLLENQGNGQPGELIRYVLMEQFLRLRNGDRFYFENSLNHQFTHEQIEQIKLIKFSDIIKSITLNNDYNLIQKNVFELPNTGDNRISTECFNHLRKLLQIYPCIDSNDQDRNDGNTENTRNCITLSTLNINETSEQCLVDTKFINYFNGSELSFILTLLSIPLFIIVLILIMKLLIYRRNKMNETQRIKVSKLRRMTINDDSCTIVQEYVGRSDGYRNIILVLDLKMKAIIVKLQYESRIVRSIYLRKCTNDCRIHIELSINQSQNYMLIRFPKEYDLILKFDSYYDREKFLTKFEKFLNDIHYPMERSTKDLRSILKSAYTKSKRQKHLEKFFNVLFSQAFNHQNQQNQSNNNKSKNNLDLKTFKEIMATELTEFEFAEVLSMRPEASFVKQMFRLIDKDNNGYISFREFLDVIIIFTKGSAEQKIRIMFDMYDVDQNERLSIDDFSAMIKSLLEIANQSVSAEEMNETIRSMLVENGFTSKKELTFDDFSRLFHNYKEELGYTELNFDLSKLDKLPSIATHLKSTATSSSANNNLNKIKRQSKLMRANDLIVQSYFGGNSGQDFTKLKQTPTFLKIETQENQIEPDWFVSWIRFLDARKKEIFFLILYNLIALIIFIDKAYYYVSLNESSGLRQIAGMGIPITRGSASVMMFNFSTILLTMCRNLITMIRETFLHRFIPFDSVVSFHKYIAYLAFIMSLIHSFGHISNFYHVSTQRPSDLNCILSETYFRSNEMPKFHHWAFETLTGLTGILLLALLFIIYIFAIPYSRRHIFNAFWLTHSLYPLFYLLMVLHGLGRLVQPPIFYCYFVIPLTLFTIDKLISASRKKIEISVINATLHPSNVTHLEFKKPPNFDYKSGQWLRIACLGLNPNEYHPFTIASAPHESTLSLYIRAVGPFTKNIRQMYDHNLLNGRPYPKLYLDGPYGEGHQDWFRFDVSVLVGGGIGITPFASIIKDITFRSSINAKINCKKVYFIWVTRTQKHFEWMSDVIREAEEKDVNNLLVTHIFITQFYEKFDLRTTMLYICERHFQRISNKSLFTGLRAKTHFGRPNFEVFFDSLQYEHRNVERVGVFSCGPNPMTNSVQQACDRLNRKEGIIFNHHFENF